MNNIKLDGAGKIVSYTIIHDGPEAFKTQIPYALAIIELDDGPRITAQIVDVPIQGQGTKNSIEDQIENQPEPQQDLAIGSRVTSVFRKISEDGKSGTIQYGYKFKLTSKSDSSSN